VDLDFLAPLAIGAGLVARTKAGSVTRELKVDVTHRRNALVILVGEDPRKLVAYLGWGGVGWGGVGWGGRREVSSLEPSYLRVYAASRRVGFRVEGLRV
jgi:hypothetical protein